MAETSGNLARGALGPFRLEERLGRAGECAVYRASQTPTGKPVRLHVMESGDMDAFLRRARASAALEHVGAAAIVAVGTADGVAYAATEWIEGETIAAVGKRKPHAVAEALRMIRAVGDVLAAAHQKGIAHGDVSAENVIVHGDALVLTAFGLRAGDAAADQRAWGLLADTLLRAHPETPGWIRATVDSARAEGFASMRDVVDALHADTVAQPKVVERASSPTSAEGTGAGPATTPRAPPLRMAWIGLAAIATATAAVVALRVHAAALTRVDERDAGKSAGSEAATLPATPASLSFAAAMQARRDASLDASKAALEETLRLDPSFAGAHLRLAIDAWYALDDAAFAHFGRARDHRDRLDVRERILLDAFAPIMRADAEPALAVARMESAVRAQPGDAELRYHLGLAYWMAGEFTRAIEAIAPARELDPTFVEATDMEGYMRAYVGDPGAVTLLEKCVDVSSAAVTCLFRLAQIDINLGRAEDAERLARRTLALNPSSARGYRQLADALECRGGSDEAITDALERFASLSGADQGVVRHRTRAWHAVLRGRFDVAREEIRGWQREVAVRTSEFDQVDASDTEIDLLRESGRASDAAHVARTLLGRIAGYTPDVFFDVTLTANADAYQTGVISAAAVDSARKAVIAKRDAGALTWLAGDSAWLSLYGIFMRTEEDARVAVAARSGFGPSVPTLWDDPSTFQGYWGMALLRAGRPAEALAPLARASHTCSGLEHPFIQTWATMAYADALSSVGDVARACAALSVVRARWSAATPASMTGRRADVLARSLKCAP